MTRVTRKERSPQMLFAALELSTTTWVVAATDRNGVEVRWARIPARDLDELERFFRKAKADLGLSPSSKVTTCYEAGRDGFWVHRALAARRIVNVVLDPASIEVPRRQRHAKSDRLDAGKLLSLLLRLNRGERAARLVTVPSVDVEDRRQATRERDTLMSYRTAKTNEIAGLLATQGIACAKGGSVSVAELGELRLWNGAPLPPLLFRRLKRAVEEREFIQAQIKVVDKELNQEFKKPLDEKEASSAVMLHQLAAIGTTGAQVLSRELFWRDFSNRRQVAGYTGLCSVPKLSGSGGYQGAISKAGNRRVRALLVEEAWGWLRFQPESELTLWFHKRFGTGKRNRKVGIVALARKLAIALWRYLKFGVVPAGAQLRAA